MMWFSRLKHWNEEKIPCALCTIVKTSGSTPREPGTKMTVNENGEIAGTVGGGALEHDCIARALEVIRTGKPQLQEYNQSGEEWTSSADNLPKSAICGGKTTVFIEPVYPEKKLEIVIYGAGHIGEKLAAFCRILGWSCRVFDDREEFLTEEKYPEADLIRGDFKDIRKSYCPGASSFCVIMTYGHQHDQDVLEQLLRIEEIPYIGMIGSRAKVVQSLRMMQEKSLEISDRVYSPVGLNIGTREPADIALAVAAEIRAVIQGCEISHMRIIPENLKNSNGV